MIRRPLCIAAWLLIVSSLAAHWLGISWIWRSPAGPKPEQWAIREKSVYGEGAVYRQEEKIFSNKTYTYLYLKQTSLFIESKKYPVRNVKCIVEQSVERKDELQRSQENCAIFQEKFWRIFFLLRRRKS